MGKSKKDDASGDIEDLDQEICEALLLKGWIIPQTVDEVLLVQEEFPDDLEVLPESLRISYVDLNREIPNPRIISPPAVEDESIETMARAARLGKRISPEIEALMRRDRDSAEKDADDS